MVTFNYLYIMIMFFIILKLRSKREKKKGKQTGIKEALAKILTKTIICFENW